MKLVLLAVVLMMSGCATGFKAVGMVMQGIGEGAKVQTTQNQMLYCNTLNGGYSYTCQ